MNIKLIMENWNKFLNEEEVKDKKKADLDKDGELSGYEKKRAAAIEKSMADQEGKKSDEEDPIEEADEGAFAPNHYCVHHGGVQHEGRIIEAEAIQHNYDFDLGRVTHYDMRLPNGTILEDVAAEDILITNASLAEGHPGKREKGHKKLKEKKCPSCKKDPCEC